MTDKEKKIILLTGEDYDRLENFLEIIIEATQSNYNKKYKRIHIKEDIITDKLLECDLPEEEATSHICVKIRPFLLERDKYTKITKILREIIANEEKSFKAEHEALIKKSEEHIKEIADQKNNAFNLYMYGKYAKGDCEKRKIIKQMPKMIEGGFYNSLHVVFGSLVCLANLYMWFKKEYEIEAEDGKKAESVIRTFGI